jgi:hypothetical protein
LKEAAAVKAPRPFGRLIKVAAIRIPSKKETMIAEPVAA